MKKRKHFYHEAQITDGLRQKNKDMITVERVEDIKAMKSIDSRKKGKKKGLCMRRTKKRGQHKSKNSHRISKLRRYIQI